MESDSDMRGFSSVGQDVILAAAKLPPTQPKLLTGAGVRGSLAQAAGFLYFIYQVRGKLLFSSEVVCF